MSLGLKLLISIVVVFVGLPLLVKAILWWNITVFSW